MTRRICIFGNSHVAAIRSAWTEGAARWPDLQVHCIGAHRGLLLETEVRHGWLRPTSAEAKSAFARLGGGHGVRLKDYDAFVVAGGLVSLAHVVGLYRHMHWVGLNTTAAQTDLTASSKALVSRNAVLDTATHTYSNRMGPCFIRHLRPHTDRPIYLTAQPRVSADLLDSADPTVQGHKQVHKADDGPALVALGTTAAERAIEKAGGQYLSQPPETIQHHIMTDPGFMRGAKRLTADGQTPQPPSDLRHGNANYGAALLNQIAAIAP